jgi:hypothetical protein
MRCTCGQQGHRRLEAVFQRQDDTDQHGFASECGA